MALTAGVKIDRRGPPGGGSYGYFVAAGERIWRGGLVAVNAAGTLQRVQTAGSLVVVGLATQDYDNTASASVSTDAVVVERGRWQITVPAATAANIGQTVYCTDDNTTTLSSGSGANLACGTIDGIDVGLMYVRVSGT